MAVIFAKDLLRAEQKQSLQEKFRQFNLYICDAAELETSAKAQCSLIEILYGSDVSIEELESMPQLRWIHVPGPQVEKLPLRQIREHGNILVTSTKNDNLAQIGEFTITAIQAFQKNLFKWKNFSKEGSDEKKAEFKKSMQTAGGSLFLQIGLGSVGTEIARRAVQAGYKVIGIKDPPSFHPYCYKVLSIKNLHSSLPVASVVSIALSRDQVTTAWFKEREMKLMKEGSLFSVIGTIAAVDIQALEKMTIAKKFKGIVVDAPTKGIISSDSLLWSSPEVLITPDISAYPMESEESGFSTFLFNLRQFLHGNFGDMRNLMDRTTAISKEWIETT
ncbi:MAG: D-2-hydroxyacid dehydrogenase [Chlamydiales bacterium]